MAVHSKTESMLKESLQEMLIASELCIKFKKDDNGCLGYPATAMLLSVADAIGSYFVGSNLKILIDGRERMIDGDGFKHLFIFNSKYYDLQLSEKVIKIIYDNYRSLLVHNLVLAKKHFIMKTDPLGRPFAEDGLSNSVNGENYFCISLVPLFISTKLAVNKFLEDIDAIVPSSRQSKIIDMRK